MSADVCFLVISPTDPFGIPKLARLFLIKSPIPIPYYPSTTPLPYY